MKILKKSRVLFFIFVLMVMSFFLVDATFSEASVYAAETTPPLVTFIADDGDPADLLLLKAIK